MGLADQLGRVADPLNDEEGLTLAEAQGRDKAGGRKALDERQRDPLPTAKVRTGFAPALSRQAARRDSPSHERPSAWAGRQVRPRCVDDPRNERGYRRMARREDSCMIPNRLFAVIAR
jgi:hypothetical protein